MDITAVENRETGEAGEAGQEIDNEDKQLWLDLPGVESGPDPAENEELRHIIEAVLFTLARAVDPSELARAAGCDLRSAKAAVKKLAEMYDSADGALLIREVDGKYQMCTSPKYFEYLVRVVAHPKKPELSEVLLETLAIIAGKNPATRAEIERIRGVKSDFAVNKLIEYGLIEEAGRLNVPGKPILFRPTDEFYRRFGVENSEQMPKAGPEVISRIEDEVQAEVRSLMKEEAGQDGKNRQV